MTDEIWHTPAQWFSCQNSPFQSTLSSRFSFMVKAVEGLEESRGFHVPTCENVEGHSLFIHPWEKRFGASLDSSARVKGSLRLTLTHLDNFVRIWKRPNLHIYNFKYHVLFLLLVKLCQASQPCCDILVESKTTSHLACISAALQFVPRLLVSPEESNQEPGDELESGWNSGYESLSFRWENTPIREFHALRMRGKWHCSCRTGHRRRHALCYYVAAKGWNCGRTLSRWTENLSFRANRPSGKKSFPTFGGLLLSRDVNRCFSVQIDCWLDWKSSSCSKLGWNLGTLISSRRTDRYVFVQIDYSQDRNVPSFSDSAAILTSIHWSLYTSVDINLRTLQPAWLAQTFQRLRFPLTSVRFL